MPASAAAVIAQQTYRQPLRPVSWCEEEDVRRPIDALSALGTVITVARNAEIFGEDQPAEYVYVVLSGAVRVCKLLGDGRRQIETFCLVGDAFGWETTARHRFSAESVTECRLVRIKRSLMFARAEVDAELARALWRLTATELHRAQEHLLVLGRKTAQERVATFLLDLARRVSEDGATGTEIVLPMSRQDIADYLGLTIETVSRTLTQLEEQEAIALPSSRRVLLRDRAMLRRLHS